MRVDAVCRWRATQWPGVTLLEDRLDRPADGRRVGTARMEMAALRRIGWASILALESELAKWSPVRQPHFGSVLICFDGGVLIRTAAIARYWPVSMVSGWL
jgi:hypothetical protein